LTFIYLKLFIIIIYIYNILYLFLNFNLLGSKDMPNPFVRKRQMEAYLRAVDNGTIITSLPLLTESEVGVAVPTLEAIDRCIRSDKISYLKSASPIKGASWSFRQRGCTEEDNPDHNITVFETIPLEVGGGHMYTGPKTFVQTTGIVPTMEEYIDIIFDLVKEQNGRIVSEITIDTERLLEPLQTVLADVPLCIFWQAAVSKEDKFLNDVTTEGISTLAMLDKKLCALCTVPDTDEGNPLLRCSGCKRAHYCCKEHQKIDWPNHRDLCKHTSKFQGYGLWNF